MIKVIKFKKHKRVSNRKLNQANINKNKLKFEEKNKVFITLFSLLSILLGCIIFKNNKIIPVNELDSFVDFMQSNSFVSILIQFIKYEIVFFILEFFIGTSIIGMPLVIIPPIIKCFFIGYLSSYMYNQYSVKGILFCLILIYPYFAVTTSSLIFAADESIYMSKYLFEVAVKKNAYNNTSIKLYMVRIMFLILLNLIFTIINSFLLSSIGNRFNFN